jgi:ribosomal protein S18 acetylase RimI-like enzyme
MAEAIVRPAVESDLAEVARMYADLDAHYRQFPYHFARIENLGQAWLDSFRRTLGRYSQLFVAELDGQIVGFSLVRLKRVAPYLGGFLVGEISDVWVHPAARRLHIGEALNLQAIVWLREQGAESVEVQVLEGNEPIQHLYHKLGFRPELRQLRLSLEASGENA